MKNFWFSQSVLVLGGNGYLGVEMIQELLQEGATVTSMDKDRAMSPALQKIGKEFEYVSQDLSDFVGLKNICLPTKC